MRTLDGADARGVWRDAATPLPGGLHWTLRGSALVAGETDPGILDGRAVVTLGWDRPGEVFRFVPAADDPVCPPGGALRTDVPARFGHLVAEGGARATVAISRLRVPTWNFEATIPVTPASGDGEVTLGSGPFELRIEGDEAGGTYALDRLTAGARQEVASGAARAGLR